MRKIIFSTLTVLTFSLGFLAGCADDEEDSFDNVSACQNYVDSLECGDFDPSTIYGSTFCEDTYGGLTTCDISDYFNCLADNTECIEDDPVLGDYLDQSGTTDCASLANCD